MFEPNEIVILNGSTAMDLSMRVGQRATILGKTNFLYQDYDVEFDDGEIFPVKKSELNKLTDDDLMYMAYIFTGNKVLWNEEVVTIVKVDYLHRNAEIKFNDYSEVVVSFDGIKELDFDIVEELEELQFDIYEDLLYVFAGHYKNKDNTYTVPKELLINLIKGRYSSEASNN